MQLFIHIPKTAGTSLREALQRRYGKRIAYAYGNHPLTHPILATEEGPREKRTALEAQGIELIFGHMHYRYWQHAFDRSEVLAVLRHPVDRCLSHYQHYLSHPGDTLLADQVQGGEISLQTFAKHPTMTNLQAKTLNINSNSLGDLCRFNALFTESQLLSELGVKQWLNGTERSFQVTPDDILALQEANPLDLQLYELVRQAWHEGYWCWNYTLRHAAYRFFLR